MKRKYARIIGFILRVLAPFKKETLVLDAIFWALIGLSYKE